ncbi:hypothetical protein ACFY36_44305 [Actinoplanes sp. NPDC000266]
MTSPNVSALQGALIDWVPGAPKMRRAVLVFDDAGIQITGRNRS